MPAYKDTKRNTWYCKFNYKDSTGTRKQKKKRGFKTKKEAQQWERNFLINSGDECPITFKELADTYLYDLETRCRETTASNKRCVINAKILPFFSGRKAADISPADVRKWQNLMINEGYKPTYLKFMHMQFSAIMNYGVKYCNLKENPCIKAGGMGKNKPGEMNFWTCGEYNDFIEKVDNTMYRMLFELLYWTGLREGEALALTPADIDFEKETVSVTRTFAKLPGGKEVYNPPKTEGSMRRVSLPSFLTEDLRIYIKEGDFADNERLFKTVKTSLRYAIHRYCKKANVKIIRVHDIRHSHASLLIHLGVSPKAIADRLGHDNIQTTLNIYTHLYPDVQKEVADKLDEVFSENIRI